MDVSEIKMLRWMCVMTIKDKIINQYITGLQRIDIQVIGNRSRWLGYLLRRKEMEEARLVKGMYFEEKNRKKKAEIVRRCDKEWYMLSVCI